MHGKGTVFITLIEIAAPLRCICKRVGPSHQYISRRLSRDPALLQMRSSVFAAAQGVKLTGELILFFLNDVCPTSAHPSENFSGFVNVLWKRALDLDYSIVQVKIERKKVLSVSFSTLCFPF